MKASLKEQFGPEQQHQLSTGLLCTSPFHVPDASGAIVLGRMDLGAARELLADGRYRPIASLDGSALGSLWLSDFGDSTCGPYQELTVTILVAEEQCHVSWENEWTPLAAQAQPGVYICEYVLVLNNPHAIAYGKELHGFDKHHGELTIRNDGETVAFRVSERTEPTVHGRIRLRKGAFDQTRALFGVTSALGVRKTTAALFETLHPLRVVTPTTHQQRRTDIFFRGTPALQKWSSDDELVVGSSPVGRTIQRLAFEPTAVQILSGSEGVMPFPVPTS